MWVGDPQNLHIGLLPCRGVCQSNPISQDPHLLHLVSVHQRICLIKMSPLGEKPQANGANPELRQVWQLLPCLSFLSYSFIARAALIINIDFGGLAWLPTRYFILP